MLPQHPHAKLSIAKLCKIKIVDRSKIWIIGLPPRLLTKPTLASSFSQFGKICERDGIFIGTDPSCGWAVIKFEERSAADRALHFVNHRSLARGLICRAMHGYTGYCHLFLRGKRCTWRRCAHKHAWCNMDDVVSDAAIREFHHKLQVAQQQGKQDPAHSISIWRTHNIAKREVCASASATNQVVTAQRAQIMTQRAQIKALQSELAQLKASKVTEQLTLQNSYQITTNQMRRKSEDALFALTQQLQTQRLQCNAKQIEFDALRLEYDALQLKYSRRDSECLVLEKRMQRMVQMRQEEEEREVVLKGDRTQWNFKHVHCWMLGIDDGYFAKYDRLFENLKAQNIGGACLRKLNAAVLSRLGITDRRDTQRLLQHIQTLIRD